MYASVLLCALILAAAGMIWVWDRWDGPAALASTAIIILVFGVVVGAVISVARDEKP